MSTEQAGNINDGFSPGEGEGSLVGERGCQAAGETWPCPREIKLIKRWAAQIKYLTAAWLWPTLRL